MHADQILPDLAGIPLVACRLFVHRVQLLARVAGSLQQCTALYYLLVV
jgi:hypothetical protein